MVKVIGTVIAILLAIAVVAPAGAEERSAGRVLDDAKISTVVKSKLVADKLSNLVKVGVGVKNGVVTLSGTVDNWEQRTRAEELARGAKGVQRVVNDIEVKPQTSASPRK